MLAVYHNLDGTRDKRYTVTKEFCGHRTKLYVARFCNGWIGSSTSEKEAWILAQEHYDNHKIDQAM